MASLPSFESFRPLVWGIRQPCEYEVHDPIQEDATERFPDLPKRDALLRYVIEERVKDIIFPGKNGARYRWGDGK